jgi:hypothetical protein
MRERKSGGRREGSEWIEMGVNTHQDVYRGVSTMVIVDYWLIRIPMNKDHIWQAIICNSVFRWLSGLNLVTTL